MRIAYVLNSLALGGTERQVLAIADRMAARGHAVALLVLKAREPDELSTELQVVHLDMRRSSGDFLRGWRQAMAFLREFRPDAIHSHNFHGNMLARLTRRSLPAAKLISTNHNVYEGGWLRMLAYQLTDRYADLNTAVSEAVADRFVRLKAVSLAKCVVVRNGIEIAEFAPSVERRAAMRGHMGVGTEFVWITVGRMARAKDIPNLMRAFGNVWEKYPETELWLVGANPEAEPRRNEKLFRGAWMDRVRRLGQRRGIAGLLDAADGFVLSSRWEGMPLAVGEAMSMAKPVVATDVGGVKELVGDEGVLAPAKDSGALAEAMLGVMQRSEAERAEMGRGARERILKHFAMDAKADQWEALYRSVVG